MPHDRPAMPPDSMIAGFVAALLEKAQAAAAVAILGTDLWIARARESSRIALPATGIKSEDSEMPKGWCKVFAAFLRMMRGKPHAKLQAEGCKRA